MLTQDDYQAILSKALADTAELPAVVAKLRKMASTLEEVHRVLKPPSAPRTKGNRGRPVEPDSASSRILTCLHRRGSLSLDEIASDAGVTFQFASFHVYRAAMRPLIERGMDDNGKRVFQLSPAGHDRARQILAASTPPVEANGVAGPVG